MGECVKKVRIYVRTTTNLYRGITFKFFFFHMLSSYNFLLWVDREGACITNNSKLPIIPYPTVL